MRSNTETTQPRRRIGTDVHLKGFYRDFISRESDLGGKDTPLEG